MVDGPTNLCQIIHVPLAITNAAMNDENFFLDNAAERKPVPCVIDSAENSRTHVAQAPVALGRETEVPTSLVLNSILVVSAQQPHLVGKYNLQGKHQRHHFQLMQAAVHPVTIKHKLCWSTTGREAKEVEEEKHVAELPVNVPVDLHRCGCLHQRRLGLEDLLRLHGQTLDPQCHSNHARDAKEFRQGVRSARTFPSGIQDIDSFLGNVTGHQHGRCNHTVCEIRSFGVGHKSGRLARLHHVLVLDHMRVGFPAVHKPQI
mmetsp:Transcript_57698/g.153785  ORF Transcript_57698/g.153785 Transcript_57698/m.153785 type:complete len:260 (+) Transcript_57698:718-1497(+)